MNETPLRPLRQDSGLGARLLAAVLVLAGLGCVATVFAANYGRSRAAEALAFRLGLAFAPMLSAAGLCLVLIGVFVLWRGERGR
jgi:hypothetical protein